MSEAIANNRGVTIIDEKAGRQNLTYLSLPIYNPIDIVRQFQGSDRVFPIVNE